ncbi:MAG: DUF1700 domain-containing protein [Lachnospiraceae bacterium]|nr:DUF1700 domain-containing protein [Lachnospiraceae bacterium]
MNKNEFLRQLENLLSDLPEEERREAMEYYVEYFDEAGPEKEAEVLRELGSPSEVAHNIREDLAGKELMVVPQDAEDGKKKEKNDGWKIACIILLCIFAAPVVIPLVVALAGAIIGIIVGLVSAVAGVFLASCLMTFAFAVAAIILFVIGIIKLFTIPLVGAFLLGLSLVCAGVALLLGFLVVKFLLVALPAICRGIYKLCKRIFVRKEAKA